MSYSPIDLSNIRNVINPCYYQILGCKKEYIHLWGGSGSGKSYFGIGQYLVYRSFSEYNNTFVVIRKVARTNKLSTVPLVLSVLNQWGFKEKADYYYNRSDYKIYIPRTNTTIHFLGIDDPEKLKSIHDPTSFWLEEATELKEEDFEEIDRRLRVITENKLQVIFCYNPISCMHWLKKRFHDDFDSGSCKLIKTTLRNNHFINQVAYYNKLKRQSSNAKEIYIKGNWGLLEGLVYPDWVGLDNFPEIGEFDKVVYGLDFGFSNPSALIMVGYIGEDRYIKELLYTREKTNAQLIELIDKKYPEIKANRGRIYADSAEPARIKEFRQAGYSVYKANKKLSKADKSGGEGGLDFCRRQTVFFDKESKNIVSEHSGYVYAKDKDGNSLEVPIKNDDHLMDAYRYVDYTEHLNITGGVKAGNPNIRL